MKQTFETNFLEGNRHMKKMKLFSLLVIFSFLISLNGTGWAQESAITAQDLAELNQKLMSTVDKLNDRVDSLEMKVNQKAAVSAPAAQVEEGTGLMKTAGGDIQMYKFAEYFFLKQ